MEPLLRESPYKERPLDLFREYHDTITSQLRKLAELEKHSMSSDAMVKLIQENFQETLTQFLINFHEICPAFIDAIYSVILEMKPEVQM